jgi:hypothetical protein
LGDRTKHLPDQHRGRRLFCEEIRRCRRDQRDAQRFEEIMACELDGQVAREAIGLSTRMQRTPLPAFLSSMALKPGRSGMGSAPDTAAS